MTRQTQRSTRKVRRAAFTLMEMLVVVAIIVALAGLGGFYFLGQLEQSKVSSAKVQMKTLTQACEVFATKNGRFPENWDELFNLELGGPYLKSTEAIQTPWNGQYILDKSGQKNSGLTPDIYCQYHDTVIGNWPGGR